MTARPGRPFIPGTGLTGVTLRLNTATQEIIDAGAKLLADMEATVPNRSAWLRNLFAFLGDSDFEELMTAQLLQERWPASWFETETPHKLTVKLLEVHRIWLRQFECYAQSLDWSRELMRNEAALLVISAHGPVFNRTLENRK